MFGDPEVMPVKVIWDYAYYWGVLAQFFFQRRLADLPRCRCCATSSPHCQSLNLEVQALLRAWSASRPGTTVDNPAVMLDQADLPWFAELNRGLPDRLGDAAFRERIRFSTRQMRSLAAEVADRAEGSVDAGALRRLISEGAAFGNATVEVPMLFERA